MRWKGMDEEKLKALLLKENKEFRVIHKEHKTCEKRLDVFKKKGSLNAKETIEEKELKKKKLILKDKMYRIMVDHTRANP
jgi:uncharacterized protein YdcH (DUF465 family)